MTFINFQTGLPGWVNLTVVLNTDFSVRLLTVVLTLIYCQTPYSSAQH